MKYFFYAIVNIYKKSHPSFAGLFSALLLIRCIQPLFIIDTTDCCQRLHDTVRVKSCSGTILEH